MMYSDGVRFDFLLVVAQLGVALAGFTGIVRVFRPSKGLKPNEVAGVKLVLEFSLFASVSALFPFVLLAWKVSEPSVWYLCGSAISAFSVFESILQALRIDRVRDEGAPARLENWLVFFIIPVTFSGGVFHALISPQHGLSFQSYISLLCWLLGVAAIQFGVFIAHFNFVTDDA